MPPPKALRALADRFDPTAFDAPSGPVRLRLNVTGQGSWDAVVDEERLRLAAADEDEEPDASLAADLPTWRRIAADVTGGLEAYTNGRLALRRNLNLSVGFLVATSGATDPGRVRFRTVRAPGARFSILEAGVGDPVVMLHGLGATKISFLPPITVLAQSYRTIAVDLPGFGDSGKPLGASYDAAFFARSVESLLDELGIERAHIVGHSMGGRVGIEFGLARPERTASLVLMTPALAWRRPQRWGGFVRLLRPELGLLQAAPRGVVEGILKRVIPGSESPWVGAGIDEFVRSYCTARGRAAFYAAARHIYLEEGDGPSGFWTRLSGLTPPALFIWGERDELIPIGFERHVRACLPRARHLELNCGHVPQLERPGETVAAIAGFLDERPPIAMAEAV